MRKFTNVMRFLAVFSLSLILVAGYAQKSRSPLSTKAPQQGQVIQPSTAATADQSMTMSEDVKKAGKQPISVPVSTVWNTGISFEKPVSNEIYDPSKYPAPDQGGETVATALVINPATNPYTDAGTTLGYVNDYDETCPYSGGTAPDVCYSYTPTSNVGLDIDLCASSYDTKVFVYQNSVTPGSPYACNDDYYFAAPCYTYSSAIFDMPAYAGNTYYIIVDGYGSSAGSYSMTVTSGTLVPPPYNDECTGAIVQTLTYGVPATFTGNNLGATQSTPSFPKPDVWEAFTLPGVSTVVLDYCSSGAGTPWGNVWLNLATDCPVTAFTTGATFEGTTCGDGNFTLTWVGLPAGTYYYPVMLDPAYNSVGDYTIHVVANPVSGGTGCENTSSYGSATVDPTGLLTTISTCSYAQEYSTVSGIVTGQTYQFTMSNLGTGAYITITDGAGTSGNILAYGPSPLNYVSALTGILYAHWSLNEFCATDVSCHITTVQCTSCVVPCNIDCPPGGIAENEPDILDEGLDVTNGGCNSTPNVFSPISDGQTICGNFNTYLYTGLQYRDTDWYQLDLSGATGNTIITWTLTAEFPSQAFIIGGPCPGTILTSAASNPCVPAVCTYVVAPGIYWLFAGGSVFTGYPAGGDWDYTATVTLAPGPVSPPNDECVNAEPVTGPYPQTVTGTLVGATVDCPGVLNWNAVWYEVTLPYASNQLTIDFCGTVGSAGQSFGIVYYDECGMCSNYIVGTYNFATCPDLNNITVVWNNIVGPGTVFFPAYISAAIPFTATFNVIPGAVANITPASFTKYAAPGESVTDVLNVANTGGAALNYTATVNYGAKATATCYPQNVNYWTGSTSPTAKTQVSQINIFAAAEQAWAQFDVSSIPLGATVTSVSVSWYVNDNNCPWQQINALSVDPVTTPAATLYAAITGGALYTNYSQCPLTGWNTVTLGGNANADLTAALASGKWGVSFYEFESSTYFWTADGWAEVNKPYITVNYTTTPLWLTVDGAQSTTGSVIGGGSQPINVGFNATGLAAGTYTGDITFSTNEPGAKATHIVPVAFYVGYTVSGNVYYVTSGAPKPMATNTTVSLTPGFTVPTSAGGAYLIRPVANGAYKLSGATTKAWGGLNSFDATLVARYLGSIVPLTNLQKRAADVNLTNTITSFDGTLIKRRLGSIATPQWIAPNYVFDGPFPVTPLLDGMPVTVSGANVTQNLNTLCSGDVNNSYTPPAE